MTNIRSFRKPHPEAQHDRAPEAPDTEKLQHLLSVLNAASQAKPVARDREIRIRNFRSDRLELLDDLIIVLEERGDQYLANSYDTGQYGIGYSPDAAIQDLCSVLEDYYDLLAEDEERLSESLKAHLRYLRSILRERE
jgi:hypothetical protein